VASAAAPRRGPQAAVWRIWNGGCRSSGNSDLVDHLIRQGAWRVKPNQARGPGRTPELAPLDAPEAGHRQDRAHVPPDADSCPAVPKRPRPSGRSRAEGTPDSKRPHSEEWGLTCTSYLV